MSHINSHVKSSQPPVTARRHKHNNAPNRHSGTHLGGEALQKRSERSQHRLQPPLRRIDTLKCPCGSIWELRRPGKDGRAWDGACQAEGGGRRTLNAILNHYKTFVGELRDGPEGPAGDLPWNVERGGRSRKRREGPADPCLTERQIDEYAAALPHHPELISYLHSNGISYKTARTYRFGAGGPLDYRSAGLVIPVELEYGWITYRLRQWPLRKPKEVPPRDQPLGVWPRLPEGDALVYLVESALAAACLRQRGFNAYAVHGASQYSLCGQVGERAEEVVVLWDVGVEQMAANAVEAVRSGGAKATLVALGLDHRDGPDDWFTKHHKGVDELHTLIDGRRSK